MNSLSKLWSDVIYGNGVRRAWQQNLPHLSPRLIPYIPSERGNVREVVNACPPE
jgi:hypothetical protein